MLSRLFRPTASAISAQLGTVTSVQGSQLPSFGLCFIRPLTSGKPALMGKGPEEGPERDLVNFPRPKRLIYNPPVRFGFVPDEWFQFFYTKTGVTGPYAFGIGFLTYVLSKEIWVLEHEFWGGVSFFMMIIYAVKKFGPQVAASLDKQQEEIIAEVNAGKASEIQFLKDSIEAEKKRQWEAEGQKVLFEVKRENVALQLEAVYRQRVMDVYNEVKKRLDYQVQKQQVERNVQQKHMVNWIIGRVQKAITPESEQENLKKCIADLKGLAAKY